MVRRVKIAMVSPGLPPEGGGIGAYTDKTSRVLAARGHDVHVLIPGTSQLTTETIDGVQLHRVPNPSIRPTVLARAWAVRRTLVRLGPFDVVQACEWEARAWWYSLRPQAPLVTRLATPHSVVDQQNEAPRARRLHAAFGRWLERDQTRRSARVVCPSRTLAREVGGRWGIDPDTISIVPNGIHLPRSEVGRPPAELRGFDYVLYFGRLERRKGVDTWIEALPQVLETYPTLHAVFVGEDLGMAGRPFEEYARERCARDWPRLHFLPAMSHPRLFPIVAGSRMVVMPSRFESLANACLEAMALGRPVVATTGTGLAEMITDSVDGFLVPAGDASALAVKACAALADDRLLLRIGRAARRRVADFDLEAMVDRLLEVYAEILQPRAVPTAMVA
jgi:glycosyltransferase involved in cell wall biosynthesis